MRSDLEITKTRKKSKSKTKFTLFIIVNIRPLPIESLYNKMNVATMAHVKDNAPDETHNT